MSSHRPAGMKFQNEIEISQKDAACNPSVQTIPNIIIANIYQQKRLWRWCNM